VGALDVSSVGQTDGDAVGCWFEPNEIARYFEKVPSDSRVDYNWRGGGRHCGSDNLANIV
jgi:hypothetical protein